MVSTARPNHHEDPDNSTGKGGIPASPRGGRPRSGEGKRRPTIVDVARAAGVSTAVVSYALNGRRGVAEVTRERVLRVADELGWRPATAARSLRAGPGAAALVAVHDGAAGSRAASTLDLVTAASEVLDDAGVTLAVHTAGTVEQAAHLMRRWWAERRYAGFVVTGLRSDDARLAALRHLPAPAVMVGDPSVPAPPAWRSVVFDDATAFAQVGEFLADLGHRRVAMLTGAEGLLATRRRATALAGALSKAGIDFDAVTGDGVDRAAAAVGSLLSSGSHPTAVVTDDDVTAGVVLDVARRLEIAVPWQLSVVAGTDAAACRLTTPSLTAVPYPVERLGQAVGQALLGVLRADGAPNEKAPPSVTVAAGGLVVRGSTAPPDPR
ncbi:LacI family DNA-binding transcriptional regulator [Myceligenerans salitolerans]|uniref:LacI family DNA-binding transcriptional regulator n=1 Tax=Myceligenerans salitolerans TaxID=1230528 RepID=A0ABS3I9M3_9MICO|nr:LacI family DNA-binding transcriptional regulator [Myceligenerans salitolerans]MBO0609697.1 LacI family DNA-binding transcriptional regulator [Myceligenerans salitolerans]